MGKKMVGLVVLFTQPASRAKANRADGQQGQQPFHRERGARLGESSVLYGRGPGGSRSRGRGGRGRRRSDRRRNNGGHAVPLGVQDDVAGNSAVKAEAVLAALLGIPAAEHPAVLFGGGRLAGLVAAYKGLAGNIGTAMPAQVKADRYQLVPLGIQGQCREIFVAFDSTACRTICTAAIRFGVPTGKNVPFARRDIIGNSEITCAVDYAIRRAVAAVGVIVQCVNRVGKLRAAGTGRPDLLHQRCP